MASSRGVRSPPLSPGQPPQEGLFALLLLLPHRRLHVQVHVDLRQRYWRLRPGLQETGVYHTQWQAAALGRQHAQVGLQEHIRGHLVGRETHVLVAQNDLPFVSPHKVATRDLNTFLDVSSAASLHQRADAGL